MASAMRSAARTLVASSSRTPTNNSIRSSLTRWMTSRNLHQMRPLPYPMEDGVGMFLPPPALRTVVEWQKGLLDRLNDLVRDTEFANQSIVQTVLGTALDEEYTLAFNHASLALNNSFFLENIKPPNNHEDAISPSLAESIQQQLGGLDQLKSTFSAAAMGLSSSGWIWLVTDGSGRLAVLPTFGSGTLLIRSRRLMASASAAKLGSVVVNDNARRASTNGTSGSGSGAGSGIDASTNPLPPFSDAPQSTMRSSPTSGIRAGVPPLNPQTQSRALHSSLVRANANPASIYNNAAAPAQTNSLPEESIHVQQKLFAEMGSTLYPLLCLSVHEHAWVSAGLGVWGREEYLKRFWSVVDWEKVSRAFDEAKSRSKRA